MALPTFQEINKRAMRDSFVNRNPFSIEIIWDGVPLRVVEDTRIELLTPDMSSVNTETKTLNFNREDMDREFKELPKSTQIVDINGVLWKILDIKTPQDFVIITIQRWIS